MRRLTSLVALVLCSGTASAVNACTITKSGDLTFPTYYWTNPDYTEVFTPFVVACSLDPSSSLTVQASIPNAGGVAATLGERAFTSSALRYIVRTRANGDELPFVLWGSGDASAAERAWRRTFTNASGSSSAQRTSNLDVQLSIKGNQQSAAPGSVSGALTVTFSVLAPVGP